MSLTSVHILFLLYSLFHSCRFQESKCSAQVSLKHQIGRRCLGCCLRTITLVKQKFVQSLMQCPLTLCGFQCMFHCLNKPFCNKFVAGWYGANVSCCTPLACRKTSISCETSCGPLSETSCGGDPTWLNIPPNASMVLSLAVDFTIVTLRHLLQTCNVNMHTMPWLLWMKRS